MNLIPRFVEYWYRTLHWNVVTCSKKRIIRYICLILSLILVVVIILSFQQKARYIFEFDTIRTEVAPKLPGNIYGDQQMNIGIACAVTTHGLFAQEYMPKDWTNDSEIDGKLREGDMKIAQYLSLPNASVNVDNMVKGMPVFVDLVPSLCQTMSSQFAYKLFVSYDYNDLILATEKGAQVFSRRFDTVKKSTCSDEFKFSLVLVKCKHTGKPARAQNDAMMAAYRAGMDYLYRINDDTILKTPHWTEAFISVLKNYNPPNIGVVGPSVDAGSYQNTYILTYEFLHRTHMEIFGFHYPDFLTTWFADDWISHVYQPGRSTRLKNVLILHTQLLGRRYTKDIDGTLLKTLEKSLLKDKKIIQEYLYKHYGGLPSFHNGNV